MVRAGVTPAARGWAIGADFFSSCFLSSRAVVVVQREQQGIDNPDWCGEAAWTGHREDRSALGFEGGGGAARCMAWWN
ncbi:hypothetical protein M0R45_001577 [Rubus argutus]|uniref:Uncharacterized protein n=1 Tax=Rubus argutus TaxID=59490 RepID=A0AAW1VKC5_RUBAR